MRRAFQGRAGLALAFMLGLVIAVAGTATAARLITGKQIKNGTITQADLSKAVRAALGRTGARGPTGPGGPGGPAGPAGAPNPNAEKLGGLAPAAYQQRTPWALILGDGSILAQAGGLAVKRDSVGRYIVDLGQPATGKGFFATPNWQLASTSRIDVSVSPCGTNAAAGEYDCGAADNDGRHVIVATADSYNNFNGLQDEAFYFVVVP